MQIHWKGPLLENDRAQQIEIVQQFVSSHVSGIVLAPLDNAALVKPVQSAMAQHIPVVIIDSALDGTPGKDFVCFVATNNHKGGVLGGERLAELLNRKGKVVLLRYDGRLRQHHGPRGRLPGGDEEEPGHQNPGAKPLRRPHRGRGQNGRDEPGG